MKEHKIISSSTIFSIYLLYPTDRDDEHAFYKALENYNNIGTEIKAYLIDWEKMDGLPKSYLYVPANHEAFVHRAYKDRLLTKEQISSINCEIIKKCDLLILFGSGRICTNSSIAAELRYVKQEEIPLYTMPDLSLMAIQSLKLAIKLIVRAEEQK